MTGWPATSSDIQDVLRASGDDRTVVNTKQPAGGFSTYGQTDWSLAMGTRFFSALARGCSGPSEGASRILALMSEVVPEPAVGYRPSAFRRRGQRFASKAAGDPAPDGRYLVRQFGIVETSRADAALFWRSRHRSSDGSFAGGIAVLDDLAAAVAGAMRLTRSPVERAC